MLNRIEPQLPAAAMKTYSIASPKATHYRPATCAEVGCEMSLKGWETKVDVSTVLGARQANYIRLRSGRAFLPPVEIGDLVIFTFPAGQTCFAEHLVPLGRPEFYLVRDGDWRGNPRGTAATRHNADTWVDDFANHQQRLADRLEQG
jgi:hypothetical protein